MKGNFLGKVSAQEYVVMCCHKIFKSIGELCESLPYLGTGVYLARIYLGTGVYLARIYLG